MLFWDLFFKAEFPCGSVAKNLPGMQEMQLLSLGQEDLLEKEMATHPNILAWRILCIQEPGGLNPGSPWGHKSWARLSD